MAESKPQDVRFRLHHQLNVTYQQLLDELAQTDLTDGQIGKIAQLLMRSRQAALSPLVPDKEMAEYYKVYPQDE